jgi:protein-disulfide isomerase
MNKETKILIGVALIVIIAGIALFFGANPTPLTPGKPLDEQSLIRENSYHTGSTSAKVKIVEFGDFQCPACGKIYPALKTIKEIYKDNPEVSIIFRHFPLTDIHANAFISSEAAEAAGAQGKFWEMFDLLYTNQKQWETSQDPLPIFTTYAEQLGLDSEKFKTEISNHLYEDIINTDVADGDKIGVNATPTFYINGQKQEEIPTVEEFNTKIEAILNQK